MIASLCVYSYVAYTHTLTEAGKEEAVRLFSRNVSSDDESGSEGEDEEAKLRRHQEKVCVWACVCAWLHVLACYCVLAVVPLPEFAHARVHSRMFLSLWSLSSIRCKGAEVDARSGRHTFVFAQTSLARSRLTDGLGFSQSNSHDMQIHPLTHHTPLFFPSQLARRRAELRIHVSGMDIPGPVTASVQLHSRNPHPHETHHTHTHTHTHTFPRPQVARRRAELRIHVSGTDIPDPLTSFDQLSRHNRVHNSLLRNVREAGYESPTPIQAQAIPILLGGREVLACAPTGSGVCVCVRALIPLIFSSSRVSLCLNLPRSPLSPLSVCACVCTIRSLGT